MFNSYISNIDKSFIQEICMSKGKLIHFNRNEDFSTMGQTSSRIGYILKGTFKYVCLNTSENKEYNTGFSFSKEFVADYPACLYGIPSQISIRAICNSDVYVIDSKALASIYDKDIETQRKARINAEQLFLQTYSRFLDMYRKSPEERYMELLKRDPQILQTMPLKEIASYLGVTPTTMSRIRRKITFSI